MGIETQLTLALAAGIVAVAAFLQLTMRALTRLFLVVTGRERPAPAGSETPRRARPRSKTRPLWPRIAHAAGAAAETAAFLVRAFAQGLLIAAIGIARGVTVAATGFGRVAAVAAANAAHVAKLAATRVRPQIAAAARTSARAVASAVAWTKPRVVLVIATLQHLGHVVVERSREWIGDLQRERQARPGEASSVADGPRVIDLERDFDPLTDDFPEDERVSSSL